MTRDLMAQSLNYLLLGPSQKNVQTPAAYPVLLRIAGPGVTVVAPWLTNPTRDHEVSGSVPALAQWVNDPTLP